MGSHMYINVIHNCKGVFMFNEGIMQTYPIIICHLKYFYYKLFAILVI